MLRAVMRQKHKGLLIRCALLAVFGVALFVLLSPFIYRPRTRTSAIVTLSDVGVTIQSGSNPGTIHVKVDDREETIPRGQEERSALYREASQRIASNTHLGERYIAFSWFRFIRWWLPPIALAYWLLFRLWQPRRDYVEG
jgi:hypothetical protein